MEQWDSLPCRDAEMRVKQEILGLFSSKWPPWGKAFATNKAEKCPGSEASAFFLRLC